MTLSPTQAAASFASILVHFDLTPQSKSRGKLAMGLATDFGAHLIGAAAEQMLVPIYTDMTPNVSVTMMDDERERVESDLVAAKASFFSTVGAGNNVEWRSDICDPRRFLTEQARAADLVVVGRQAGGDPRDGGLGVSPGAVAIECGRPILVAPPKIDRLSSKRVVIAWKDTREARRAIRDSMPFLQKAEEVLVVSATREFRDRGAEDVVGYLGRHGVTARSVVRTGEIPSIAAELLEVAREAEAGLIVSGAYGHSRTREWIFGGATHDLLQSSNVCLLMSH
ncbi:universal stress protein [Methylopila sp. 73B]|uniref:universal stress protein n=1 Tax=Methylopila sp. 73B TaxID=1120792 RepID=UPI00046534AA|nr:universal stress protein [Methylopila sp. 73B]